MAVFTVRASQFLRHACAPAHRTGRTQTALSTDERRSPQGRQATIIVSLRRGPMRTERCNVPSGELREGRYHGSATDARLLPKMLP